jgi:hypothetical protein
MLMDFKLIDIFWTQEMHTTVHIKNRVMLRNNTNKNAYEPFASEFLEANAISKEKMAEWESLTLM